MRHAAWFLLLILSACGGEEPAPPGAPPEEVAEWVRPYDGWLPGTAPEHTGVVRVIDERTGEPIVGAIVRRHLEMEMGPDGWGPSFEETRTDEHGIAVIPIQEVREWSAHWVAHAEGYGSDETYAVAPEEEIALLPGRDVHGRIVDAMGRPAAGLPIGYKLGCAHAPSVFDTKTDADGRFVLRGVAANGDVHYRGPGVRVDYFGGPLRRLDETPFTIAAEPAVRFEGRLIGAKPEELAPRVVHSLTTTRGVVTRIGDDGRFVLEGVARESLLELYWAPDGEGRRIDTDEFRRHAPLVWDVRKQHPAADEDELDSDDEVEVRWRVVGPDGNDVRPVGISVYRVADGFEADHDSSDDGEDVFELFAGEYEAVVGDPTSRWVAPPYRFTVEEGKPRTIVIQASAQPRLVLQLAQAPDEKFECHLTVTRPDGRIDHDGAEVETEFEDEYPVHLPATATARVSVRTYTITRFFDVGPAADGRRVAVIDWPKDNTLRFEAPDDIGHVELGGIEHDFEIEQGEVLVRTQLEGRLRLRILKLGKYNEELASGSQLVEVPPAAGAVVPLPALDYAKRTLGQLTLRDAQGRPLEGIDVEVTWFDPVTRELLADDAETDAQGVAVSHLLREGARAVWNTRALLDHGGVLEGPGPWIQQTGSARVLLDVRGPDGPLEDAVALFAGEVLETDADGFDEDAPPGRFTFDEVPAGAVRLVVCAPGYRGEERRIVLKPGETREIVVTLPER
ncbi:MAG: carboxypeptidase-like regulatory domain-containing protein [Planctomycetota bacterium]|nr:carboxypeptidase-like regulatory domain-containing protein [Planctomycetota bacterium]